MNQYNIMVGDAVYRNSCNDRVVEIRSNGIIGSDRLRGLIPFSELKPIELTEDMVKANGFVISHLSEFRHSYERWISDDICVEYKFSEVNKMNNFLFVYINGGRVISMHLLNVHEMQDALRSCMIDELTEFANNFIVDIYEDEVTKEN